MPLEGFDHCELILSIGHNPGTNHPRMMGTLHEVAKRGAPIIVLNPLHERALERFADPQDAVEMASMRSTPIASTYLQVKVGGDAAALKGIMKALLEMEDRQGNVLDHAFIATHTMGFDALAADLAATPLAEYRHRIRADAGGAGGCRPCLCEVERHHRRLWHGYHPARARHRKRPADRQSAVAPR